MDTPAYRRASFAARHPGADEDYDEGEHGNLDLEHEGRPGEAGDYEMDEDAPERGAARASPQGRRRSRRREH